MLDFPGFNAMANPSPQETRGEPKAVAPERRTPTSHRRSNRRTSLRNFSTSRRNRSISRRLLSEPLLFRVRNNWVACSFTRRSRDSRSWRRLRISTANRFESVVGAILRGDDGCLSRSESFIFRSNDSKRFATVPDVRHPRASRPRCVSIRATRRSRSPSWPGSEAPWAAASTCERPPTETRAMAATTSRKGNEFFMMEEGMESAVCAFRESVRRRMRCRNSPRSRKPHRTTLSASECPTSRTNAPPANQPEKLNGFPVLPTPFAQRALLPVCSLTLSPLLLPRPNAAPQQTRLCFKASFPSPCPSLSGWAWA